ncbi:hypothetical protein D3C72_1274620 [compost metagenome]
MPPSRWPATTRSRASRPWWPARTRTGSTRTACPRRPMATGTCVPRWPKRLPAAPRPRLPRRCWHRPYRCTRPIPACCSASTSWARSSSALAIAHGPPTPPCRPSRMRASRSSAVGRGRAWKARTPISIRPPAPPAPATTCACGSSRAAWMHRSSRIRPARWWWARPSTTALPIPTSRRCSATARSMPPATALAARQRGMAIMDRMSMPARP